jgi:subtilisin-like proprotein convertase family protein
MRWRLYISLWMSVLAVLSGRLERAFAHTGSGVSSRALTLTWVSNSFALDPDDTGAILLSNSVATNSDWTSGGAGVANGDGAVIWLGSNAQWHFYVFTNSSAFTNAAFLTSEAANLVIPAIGGTNPVGYSVSNQADVDLYVTQNQLITNLDPVAISEAFKSLNRGGTETVLVSNAQPGCYYVGVKCESRRGASYTLAGVFSDLPLIQTDEMGNQIMRGFPAPAWISPGTPGQPGRGDVFCIGSGPAFLGRVVATNTLTHDSTKALTGTLMHGGASVTLANHPTNGAVNLAAFIYDDSGLGDIAGAQLSDGPGRLSDFSGRDGAGLWQFSLRSTNQAGTNESLWLRLESSSDLIAGTAINLAAGGVSRSYIQVPVQATNLAVQAQWSSGTGAAGMRLAPAGGAAWDFQSAEVSDAAPSNSVVISSVTLPPLHAGLYEFDITNESAGEASVMVQAFLGMGAGVVARASYATAQPLMIAPRTANLFPMTVTNDARIVSVEAGVRISHPSVSDLLLRLISPQGQSVLLSENRGGSSTNGMGMTVVSTNSEPAIHYGGGSEAVTNGFDTGQKSGFLFLSYDFLEQADTMRVYYDGALLWDSGLVSYTGATNLSYGPGNSTSIVIVMNEGGNTNSTTVWNYTLSYTRTQNVNLTFTEDTSLAAAPIKFAPIPLTNSPSSTPASNAPFYLPEQSLSLFAGQAVAGVWRLEVWDASPTGTNPVATLDQWNLTFQLQNLEPMPVSLSHGSAFSDSIPAGDIQWFAVSVPAWAAYATNRLLSASQPVNVWFNAGHPPLGNGSGDARLLTKAFSGTSTLSGGSSPAIMPGNTYYLGVQNTNASAVTFSFETDFDVISLSAGAPLARTIPAGGQPKMFSYTVDSSETALEIQMLNLTGDANVVLSRELPFPSLSSYSYGSLQPGTNSEEIVVLNNAAVPLSPGVWYIAVYNADTAAVGYTILATDSTAPVPAYSTLFGASSVSSTTPGGSDNADYYRYVVYAGSARAQFMVSNISAEVALVARRGIPLPSLSDYSLMADGAPGTVDQSLVLFRNSAPVALAPGEWFVSVVAVGSDPASYTLWANQWAVTGTNLTLMNPSLTSDAFSFTWETLAGIPYFVQGKTSLLDEQWTTLDAFTANWDSSTYSLPLPSPYQFFRAGQGTPP